MSLEERCLEVVVRQLIARSCFQGFGKVVRIQVYSTLEYEKARVWGESFIRLWMSRSRLSATSFAFLKWTPCFFSQFHRLWLMICVTPPIGSASTTNGPVPHLLLLATAATCAKPILLQLRVSLRTTDVCHLRSSSTWSLSMQCI